MYDRSIQNPDNITNTFSKAHRPQYYETFRNQSNCTLCTPVIFLETNARNSQSE